MNKWIYSSISLNLYSVFCIVYFSFYTKTIFKFLFSWDISALCVLFIDYFIKCFNASTILIVCYILELILYKIFKKYAFSFSIDKMQKTKIYYFIFYFGIFIGTCFLIALVSVIPVLLFGPIYNHFSLNN